MHESVTWRKSSYSANINQNCVEVGTTWTKSSYSEGHDPNCVECRTDHNRVLLRDSTHPTHGHLAFSVTEWRALLAAVREGEV